MKSIDLAKMKNKILKALDREGGRLQARLSEIASMKNALNGIGGKAVSGDGRKRKRGPMSAATKRKISIARKKAWAAKN